MPFEVFGGLRGSPEPSSTEPPFGVGIAIAIAAGIAVGRSYETDCDPDPDSEKDKFLTSMNHADVAGASRLAGKGRYGSSVTVDKRGAKIEPKGLRTLPGGDHHLTHQ